jgi:4,5-DOPA dioxygenase extradiol
MERLPSVFISQDSPTPATQRGAMGEGWATLGRSLSNATAVLVVSAQWQTNVPMLAGSARWPRSLDTAQRARNLLGTAGFVAGIDGLRRLADDTWQLVLHGYPEPEIPLAQLSVQPALGPAHHVAIGQAIRALSEEGVLIVGSGGIADQDFHPFFVALGAAAAGARPERIDGIEPLHAYIFH